MILDMFAGPGGWSEGLRSIGLTDIGVEWDETACLTRRAAGHLAIRADAEHFPVGHLAGKVTGLIASPPCQDFSMAGNKAGRTGDRGRLIDLVPEWVETLRPEWVACEQVPPCLPIWREHAEQYKALGYNVWCGILLAADYGVPQTRKRAYLMASRVKPVKPPDPTHAKNPTPSVFEAELQPWVSMAEALGWGTSERPYWTLAPGTAGGGKDPAMIGGSGTRASLRDHASRSSWVDGDRSGDLDVNDEGVYRWLDRRADYVDGVPPVPPTPQDKPAPTITGTAGSQGTMVWRERPATTIVGSFRPDIVAAPGWRGPGDGPRQDAEGSVQISVREALILQGFPEDYPVQGSRTARFRQVGDAVCPPMAAAIVGELTGRRGTVSPEPDQEENP